MSEQKTEGRRHIQVGPALAQLRALIDQVDQKTAQFAAQANEAEASLAQQLKALVEDAKEQVAAVARDAAAAAEQAAREAIARAEQALIERMARAEALLSELDEALSIDNTGKADEIAAANDVPALATPLAATVETPRLTSAFERIEGHAGELRNLRHAQLWVEAMMKEICRADGLEYEKIKAAVEARGESAE